MKDVPNWARILLFIFSPILLVVAIVVFAFILVFMVPAMILEELIGVAIVSDKSSSLETWCDDH